MFVGIRRVGTRSPRWAVCAVFVAATRWHEIWPVLLWLRLFRGRNHSESQRLARFCSRPLPGGNKIGAILLVCLRRASSLLDKLISPKVCIVSTCSGSDGLEIAATSMAFNVPKFEKSADSLS